MLLLSDAQHKEEIKELRAINAEQFAIIAEQRATNNQQTKEINELKTALEFYKKLEVRRRSTAFRRRLSQQQHYWSDILVISLLL